MPPSFERHESPDPWRRSQPRYEALACEGADRFVLLARLQPGQSVRCPLRHAGATELRRLIVVDSEAADG